MERNTPLVESVRSVFVKQFTTEPLLIKSPGRINLIGEHTDYNDGFVLPAAIDKAICVAVQKNSVNTIRLFSVEYNQLVEVPLKDLKPSDHRWTNYILGVASQLQKRSYAISGFDLVVDGDVPLGAGLSSSAAVECATAGALNVLFGFSIPKLEQVKMAQRAEHEFAGVRCGIMDQFASVYGKKNHVIKLDCRSLEYTYVPLKLDGYKIVLLDTQVKHSLASSAYNTRREECEAGVAELKKHFPAVSSLRDATMEMVEQYLKPLHTDVYKRCRFVVGEIARLQQACDDLERNDIKAFGLKMIETHDGLRKDYEVSCTELDFLVDHVRNNSAVAGARMMGGGFGGCTINLIKESEVESVIQSATIAYEKEMKLQLRAYVVSVEDGTHIIE
jgi:galactokinase